MPNGHGTFFLCHSVAFAPTANWRLHFISYKKFSYSICLSCSISLDLLSGKVHDTLRNKEKVERESRAGKTLIPPSAITKSWLEMGMAENTATTFNLLCSCLKSGFWFWFWLWLWLCFCSSSFSASTSHVKLKLELCVCATTFLSSCHPFRPLITCLHAKCILEICNFDGTQSLATSSGKFFSAGLSY